MKVVPFVAENPAAALAQIHAELGPDAVVLSVRPAPAPALGRLWGKRPAVEVLACVMDAAQPRARHPDIAMPPLKLWNAELVDRATLRPRICRSIAWIESMGLLRPLADRLEKRLVAAIGEIQAI